MNNATTNEITPLATINHMKARLSRMETKLNEIESSPNPIRYRVIGLDHNAYLKRTTEGYNFSGDASDALRLNPRDARAFLAQLSSTYSDAKVYDETTALSLNMERTRDAIRWMEDMLAGQAPEA